MAEAALIEDSVDAARTRMLSHVAVLEIEDISIDDALGRVLAERIVAARDQPPFSASAMDGYAVRAADTPGRLRVVGESSAGAGYDKPLKAGEATRIFTGAPLPAGADSVVMQEIVTRDGDSAEIPDTPRGNNVRAQALDFASGDALLEPGRRLDGVSICIAASAGRARVSVVKRPRIALLPTGDEIVPPGQTPGPHQIYESVSFGLASLIASWGGVATRLSPRGDDVKAIADSAREGFETSDIVVTIGGASVGDKDLVKPALAALDLKLAVERVKMRPGKPVWFGTTPLGFALGLPGNPASALACATIFLRPLMAKMSGTDPSRVTAVQRARLARPIPENGPREHYLRARLVVDANGVSEVTPFEDQDSSLLSVFRDADALIRIAPKAPAMSAGTLVDVLRLERL